MSGQTDWIELLVSSTGRLSRTPFLIVSGALIGLTALYESVAGGTLHVLTGWLFYPLVLFCGACILSKRLHDRGRSGWWAAPILLAVLAVWPQPVGFFDFLFGMLLIWAVVELAAMPSEEGTNRFGPNPQNPASPAPV